MNLCLKKHCSLHIYCFHIAYGSAHFILTCHSRQECYRVRGNRVVLCLCYILTEQVYLGSYLNIWNKETGKNVTLFISLFTRERERESMASEFPSAGSVSHMTMMTGGKTRNLELFLGFSCRGQESSCLNLDVLEL